MSAPRSEAASEPALQDQAKCTAIVAKSKSLETLCMMTSLATRAQLHRDPRDMPCRPAAVAIAAGRCCRVEQRAQRQVTGPGDPALSLSVSPNSSLARQRRSQPLLSLEFQSHCAPSCFSLRDRLGRRLAANQLCARGVRQNRPAARRKLCNASILVARVAAHGEAKENHSLMPNLQI